MRKYIKILSLLMALLIISSFTLVGCEEKPSESISKDASSVTGALVPHLGNADYSGKTLRVLCTLKGDVYGDVQIAPTETNAEPVNDAFFARNNKLEEEYGFTIKAVYTEDWQSFIDKVRNDLLADSADYDVISSGLYLLAPLVVNGELIDLHSIENSHLSLNENWWDTASNKDMSIGNKLFFTTGDIFILDDENTVVTYFNKDLINDYNLESPYDLVYNGTWTIDRMYEMMKTVAQEDGDGVMNVTGNDVWGLVGGAFEAYKYILGSNCPQVYKDDNDLPVLGMTDERSVNAFIKVYEMFNDRSCVAYIEQYYRWDDPDANTVVDNFYSGNALFYASFMFAVNSSKMRETRVNYGIVPQPKYDENQENYTSTINPYRFYCVSITNAPHDLDFITFALEAMAYTSKIMVTPEYYQRTLQLKRFDDSESPEMLDIIFSNRIVDLSVVFNWGGCIQWYNNMLFSSNMGIVSYVDSRREAFNAEMNNTIEAIMNN
ncbi:MAG: hypothetical protein CVU97_00780 [Firmicutes bacterium HGW-Firmicutes-21]|nr:MAG: hypothetical protein CVU97_00780 [Firmicutes bacterium HGW-Firmicutes-21]